MAKRKYQPAQKAPLLDIIIPVYGRPDLLGKCLDNLPDNDDYRVTVVDDCGPDGSDLNRLYHEHGVHIVRNNKNMGFPASVNHGVAKTSAPLILLLNSDVILSADAIETMIREFDDLSVGVVGPKLVFPQDHPEPHARGRTQHAGLAVTIDRRIIHTQLGWSADHPKVNERREMQFVTGACLMTRRSIWLDIHTYYKKEGVTAYGAMNEQYGKGTFEDMEYCLISRKMGYKVIYNPTAVGEHYTGASAALNGGYPVGKNERLFLERCGGDLRWDEWRYL